MKRILAFLIAAFLCVQPAAMAQLETSSLTIQSGEKQHVFTVEIADDPEEISDGLMYREALAPDAGMLFDFGQPRQANMWMKNTLIPLDMLFIAPDGTVLAIARNAVPGSLRTINPGVAVKGVLELNGGQASELGIEPGDTVEHEIFGNTRGG